MNHRPIVLCLFTAILLLTAAVLAQGTNSRIVGVARIGGSPAAAVTVTISSLNLQGDRTTVTDLNGTYRFAAIPPGDYTVRFEMERAITVVKAAKVGLATTQRVDAALQLSTTPEAVTVTSSAMPILEASDVTTNFDAQTFATLPVNRTLIGGTTMAPGVTTTSIGTSIRGGLTYDSLYLVNGAVVIDNFGKPDNLFIEDAVQETSVLAGPISAEYGRFTGGVVSAITKPGGNEFSGTFRDDFSNPSWDKTTPLDEPQDESVLDQIYEATLGGRAIRDRLWFFGAAHWSEVMRSGYYAASNIPHPSTVRTDHRWEANLTAQLTPRHSLIGTYLNYDVTQTPYCAFACFELSTMDLDGHSLPRERTTLRYNGVLTQNLLLEATYSDRRLEFRGMGTNYRTTNPNDPLDLALGTVGWDMGDTGASWGAPVFCGVCDAEVRKNRYYLAKASYYVASERAGTHSLVSGYENFFESRYTNLYQSGSNFMIYTYEVTPEREPDGTLRPIVVTGDDIVYTPVPIKSKGSAFLTESLFINDKWDLGMKWSFNLGVRYDRSDATDSAGHAVSNDSNISPRFGAIYDVFGDRRLRVSAGYSKYVSRIQEAYGNSGGGGNPWYIYYTYDGPQIGGLGTGMGSFDVLQQLFSWFLAQGGLEATRLITAARLPGANVRVTGNLASPSVDEYAVGIGTQFGENGMLRINYIAREWQDFYVDATAPNDQVENPIMPGTYLDWLTYRNATGPDHLQRTYNALEVEASYRFTSRMNLAGNYTWSRARGNSVGEAPGQIVADDVARYPEYRSFEHHNPVGFLPTDQTHKARIWASYDLPLGNAGVVNFSLVERFDSGAPYSAVGKVDPRPYVTNPGYAIPPNDVAYYFSDRGRYRWENATATDLAINYQLPVLRNVHLFLQGKVTNVFNEHAQINGSPGVRVIRDKPFNPWTEAPVEGVNWVKSASFGHATEPAQYQQPLTYMFSAGVRF